MGRAFVEISVAAVGDPDAAAVSSTLVDVSLDLLATDAAGLTLGDSRPELRLAATSNPDAESLGLLELDVGEGPGLDCYRTAEPVVVTDLRTDDRWPRFTAAAAGIAAVRSVHALPVHRRGIVLGVLVLLDGTPGPLSRPDLALGQALADTAAVVILRDREVRRVQGVAAQLQGALDGRVAVEQAKGFVAQHHGVDVDTAFRLLREQAGVLRLQLPEVARLVVAGEVVPGGPAPSPDA